MFAQAFIKNKDSTEVYSLWEQRLTCMALCAEIRLHTVTYQYCLCLSTSILYREILFGNVCFLPGRLKYQ